MISGNIATTQQSISNRVFMSRINNNGDTIFNKIYISEKPENNLGMEIINTDKYVLTMSRDSVVNTNLNSKALIVDSVGNILKERVFFGVSYLTANSVLSVNNGDLIFAGSYKIGGAYYIYGLRTDSNLNYPPIGVNNFSKIVPTEFRLYQNYPNPFNPKTTITFDLPKDIDIRLTVYDIIGREIYSINEFRRSGTNKIEFDGSNFASGVYYYSLEVRQAGSLTGTFTDTKKMVLIK